MRFAPPSPTPRGLCRRVPAFLFVIVTGLYAVALGWRAAAQGLGVPPAIGELALGGVTLLFLFALGAYALKIGRRPAVLLEDMAILPGRLGVAALVTGLYFLAVAITPYGAPLARLALFLGLAFHALFALWLARYLARLSGAERIWSPAGHLYLGAVLVAAFAAQGLGQEMLGAVLFLIGLLAALVVWMQGANRLSGPDLAPPLRPLHGLHLFSAAAAGLAASADGSIGLPIALAPMCGVLVGLFAVMARHLGKGGFSFLWAVWLAPFGLCASFWIGLGGMMPVAGGVLLVAASLASLYVAGRLLKMWLSGQLAIRTNAASA